jgi:hypothetical protein
MLAQTRIVWHDLFMASTHTKRYRVVRIDNGISHPHTGIVSHHESAEAALTAIAVANRNLRRRAGEKNSWHPYAVLDIETGEKFTSVDDSE